MLARWFVPSLCRTPFFAGRCLLLTRVRDINAPFFTGGRGTWLRVPCRLVRNTPTHTPTPTPTLLPITFSPHRHLPAPHLHGFILTPVPLPSPGCSRACGGLRGTAVLTCQAACMPPFYASSLIPSARPYLIVPGHLAGIVAWCHHFVFLHFPLDVFPSGENVCLCIIIFCLCLLMASWRGLDMPHVWEVHSREDSLLDRRPPFKQHLVVGPFINIP